MESRPAAEEYGGERARLDGGVTVALLAYREAENLRVLLPRIRENMDALGVGYELLVVDTAQPLDDTREVCARHGARYIPQEEPQFGGAFRTAIRHARREAFLILDSDGSHDPDAIGALYARFCAGCDIVIGSRYTRGGVNHDAPVSRLMSRCLNLAYGLALGIRAKDLSTDFRLYRTDWLREVELRCEVYDVLEEVLLKIKLLHPDVRIAEVPITFRKRLYGESKRRLLPFIASYLQTLLRLFLLRLARTEARAAWLRNLILYGLFGGVGMAIDYGAFSAALALSGGARPELANVVGAVCGFGFTFSANTFLNFQKTGRLARRFVSYGLVCLCGAGISTALLAALKPYFDIYLLKAGVTLAVSLLQFLLNKLITYRR